MASVVNLCFAAGRAWVAEVLGLMSNRCRGLVGGDHVELVGWLADGLAQISAASRS